MLKFNHESKTIGQSLGLSFQEEGRIIGNMFYEIVYRDFVVQDLFDNPEEAPLELRTTSGLLEKCLQCCKNENEKTFLIWEFSKTDTLRAADDSNFQKLLSAVAMIFMMADKNKDRFINKFTDFHTRANKSMQNED